MHCACSWQAVLVPNMLCLFVICCGCSRYAVPVAPTNWILTVIPLYRFHPSGASEPDHQQIGLCMLPLRSAQSTPPNARWVPNARVLISQSRSASAFRSQLYRKKVWDEAVSLSLCFEHCYNQKQHISRAYCFGPDQLRSKSQHAATCQNHSPGFTSQITLDPFSFCKFRGSAMGYRISIFRHFKNS